MVELSWLQSLIYGFVSGLTEFFPVSAEIHRFLFLFFLGETTVEEGMLFSARLGCLLAAFISCFPLIRKINRERRIAMIPKRRRKRMPDPNSMAGVRLLRVAAFPVLLSLFAYRLFTGFPLRLWMIVLLLTANGLVLYAPQRFPSGNKNALSLSAWDALLMGFGGAVAVVPGFSLVGFITSTGLLRGTDRRFALDLCLLMLVPVLLVLAVLDAIPFFSAADGLHFAAVLRYFVSSVTAFAGAYTGILIMRFLSFKVGFSGFAYYSWGLALFIFILYLTI